MKADVSTPMPRGVCLGCGETGPLPPFGDGLCFLCATDGPPGECAPTGGAVHEDTDARREEEPEVDERRREIFEEFDGHQVRWARAIGAAHCRAQRFETWVKPARRERRNGPDNWGPTVEELKARVARRRALEARVAAPVVYAERMATTRARRNGAGNFASQEKIAVARRLREQGLSLRAIARETGLHKETVRAYTMWVDRSEAMRKTHARWRQEGRPMLPPWQREDRAGGGTP